MVLNKLGEIGLKQFLSLLSILHNVLKASLDGWKLYFCVLWVGFNHLICKGEELILALGDKIY